MPDRPRSCGRRARVRVLLGTGPLARWSDRVQALSRLLMAVLVLGAAPVAVVVGLAVHGHASTAAAAQRADRSTVSATLLADAGAPPSAPGPWGGGAPDDAIPTQAAWHTAQGFHQGLVDAPTGARAGTVVRIWVDRRGAVAPPPPGEGDVAAQTLCAAALSACGLVCLAALGHLGLVALLDRARMRRWRQEWERTEPLWTSGSR